MVHILIILKIIKLDKKKDVRLIFFINYHIVQRNIFFTLYTNLIQILKIVEETIHNYRQK